MCKCKIIKTKIITNLANIIHHTPTTACNKQRFFFMAQHDIPLKFDLQMSRINFNFQSSFPNVLTDKYLNYLALEFENRSENYVDQ